MSSDQVVSRQPSAVREIIPPKAKSALAVNPSTFRCLALCAFLIACTSIPARADLSYINKGTLGYVMASALPTKPMAQGALDIHLSPAYVQYTDNPADPGLKASGFGFGASALYSLTDHWGVGGLLGYAKMTGNDSNSDQFAANGYIATGNVVYDPFSGDNFRLPIIAGIGYESDVEQEQSQSIDGVNFGSGAWRDIYISRQMGWSAGLAPQFNTGFLRWIVFAYVESPISKAQAFDRNFGTLRPNGNTGSQGAGVTVVYRPWNLSFTYMPSFTNDVGYGETDNVYALNFQHRFQF